jgi:hypothetical protein
MLKFFDSLFRRLAKARKNLSRKNAAYAKFGGGNLSVDERRLYDFLEEVQDFFRFEVV